MKFPREGDLWHRMCYSRLRNETVFDFCSIIFASNSELLPSCLRWWRYWKVERKRADRGADDDLRYQAEPPLRQLAAPLDFLCASTSIKSANEFHCHQTRNHYTASQCFQQTLVDAAKSLRHYTSYVGVHRTPLQFTPCQLYLRIRLRVRSKPPNSRRRN